jgi:hypothetical protein
VKWLDVCRTIECDDDSDDNDSYDDTGDSDNNREDRGTGTEAETETEGTVVMSEAEIEAELQRMMAEYDLEGYGNDDSSDDNIRVYMGPRSDHWDTDTEEEVEEEEEVDIEGRGMGQRKSSSGSSGSSSSGIRHTGMPGKSNKRLGKRPVILMAHNGRGYDFPLLHYELTRHGLTTLPKGFLERLHSRDSSYSSSSSSITSRDAGDSNGSGDNLLSTGNSNDVDNIVTNSLIK